MTRANTRHSGHLARVLARVLTRHPDRRFMSLAPSTAHLIAAEFGAQSPPERRAIAAAVLAAARPTPHPVHQGVLWLTVTAAVQDRRTQIPLDRCFLLLRDGTATLRPAADATAGGVIEVTTDGITWTIPLEARPLTFDNTAPAPPTDPPAAHPSAYGLTADMACEVCARPFGTLKVRRSRPGGPFVHATCIDKTPTR